MKKQISFTLAAMFALLAFLSIASSLTITGVQSDSVSPGGEGAIIVTIENNLDRDIEDLSFSLDLASTPFTPVGSSEDSIDEIQEDDDGRLSFTIRASADAKPGNYNIPYVLNYKDLASPRKGFIGVKVISEPQLEVTSSLENSVIGEQGKISVTIVNKGLADARFVSLKIEPEGYTLLSEQQVYIGTIDSDDFETASFDVIFRSMTPSLALNLEYLDLDNKKKEEFVIIPLVVYTEEKAIELGIKKRSSVPFYIASLAALIIVWIAYRIIRKRIRMKKSMHAADSR